MGSFNAAKGFPFDRKIVQVDKFSDGTAEVTYECGHQAIWVIPPTVDAIDACAECVNEFVHAHKPLPRRE